MKKMIIGAVVAMILPLSAHSESFNYLFDVRLGIGKIGEMQIAAVNNGVGYSTTGILRTTGLVGALYDVRYELRSEGRVTDARNVLPARHTSISDEQGNISNVEIMYSADRIRFVRFDSRKSKTESARSQRGSLDPMTLIYQLIRPVRGEDACTGSYKLFDGKVGIDVTFANRKLFDSGKIECDVKYENAGNQSGVAPSGLVFLPGEDGLMHIERFRANTSVGVLQIVLK